MMLLTMRSDDAVPGDVDDADYVDDYCNGVGDDDDGTAMVIRMMMTIVMMTMIVIMAMVMIMIVTCCLLPCRDIQTMMVIDLI